jgi:hypothetical protein
MSRRGVSLLEILVALLLSAGVSVLVLTLIARAAARLRDRSERMGMAHALRVAGEVLRTGLEDIGIDSATGPDLANFGPDRIRYRATRLAGVACDTIASRLVVRISGGLGAARRMPQPGRDSVLVLALDTTYRWHPAAISSTASPAACPDGGTGISVAVNLDSAQRSGIRPGSVVRIFETMEARRYSSGGAEWLGLQSISAGEQIQPLAGPLAAITGLVIGPESAAGAPAGSPATAEAVRLQVRAVTNRELGLGIARTAPARDSMPAYVFFRNRP